MITEDYVSFETAKLLKEKGFDSECHSHYYPCHLLDGSVEYRRYANTESNNKSWYDIYSIKNLPKGHYLAPTLSMAMKWLRKAHNIYIDVLILDLKDGDYSYVVQDITTRDYLTTGGNDSYDTPEEAAETAIKYCLENLI